MKTLHKSVIETLGVLSNTVNTSRKVRAKIDITQSHLSKVLAHLRERDLITVEFSGRQHIITLTPDGEKLKEGCLQLLKY